MLDCKRRWWLFVGFAACGVVATCSAVVIDWYAATATNMPWGSELASVGEEYFCVPRRTGLERSGQEELTSVPRESFEARWRLEYASGLIACAGLFLLIMLHGVWLAGYVFPRFVEHLWPQRAAWRVLIGSFLGAAFAGMIGGLLVEALLAPKAGGMDVHSHLVEEDGMCYAKQIRTGPDPQMVPVGRQQCDLRLQYETAGRWLWRISFPTVLFLVVVLILYRSVRRTIPHGSSGNTHL